VSGSIDAGLYQLALSGETLRRRTDEERDTPRRLEVVALSELDAAGILWRAALLVSLREDAIAAVEMRDEPENRIHVANTVGTLVGDWSLAISLLIDADDSVRQTPGYVGSAYPAIYDEAISNAAATYDVNPNLLYAIIRQESAFYPAALSDQGAFGLFQFMPKTFKQAAADLQKRNPVMQSESWARSSLLLDPVRSIHLGAFWIRQKLDNLRGDTVLAVMAQNRGEGAVRRWAGDWDDLDDVELRIELARAPATRIFVRGVLTDLAIAEAAQVLDSN
jgi:hypothetical protein